MVAEWIRRCFAANHRRERSIAGSAASKLRSDRPSSTFHHCAGRGRLGSGRSAACSSAWLARSANQ